MLYFVRLVASYSSWVVMPCLSHLWQMPPIRPSSVDSVGYTLLVFILLTASQSGRKSVFDVGGREEACHMERFGLVHNQSCMDWMS